MVMSSYVTNVYFVCLDIRQNMEPFCAFMQYMHQLCLVCMSKYSKVGHIGCPLFFTPNPVMNSKLASHFINTRDTD
jgi:hypothetical protein